MQGKVEGHERDLQLSAQRSQQIKSLERDLATKEEAIHKIAAEKEQAMMLANQVREWRPDPASSSQEPEAVWLARVGGWYIYGCLGVGAECVVAEVSSDA